MGSYFTCRGTKKYSTYLIYYQYLGYVVRIGPHNCKLLHSSLTIKFSYRFLVADSHYVEYRIKSSSYTLTAFIPHLKQLCPLDCHDVGTSIGKYPLNKHIFLKKIQLLHHISRRHLHSINHSVLIRIYHHQLIHWTSYQLVSVSRVPHTLTSFHWKLQVSRSQTLRSDHEQLHSVSEGNSHR